VKGKSKVDGSNNHQKNFSKYMKEKHNGKNKKNKIKGQGKEKGKNFKCHKCGAPNHFAKKCWTLQHLIELYQKTLKETNIAKRLYETHFNDVSKEATISETKVEDLKIPRMTDKDMDLKNTIVEYNFNDVFGDLN
jgi:hypothetical protein